MYLEAFNVHPCILGKKYGQSLPLVDITGGTGVTEKPMSDLRLLGTDIF